MKSQERGEKGENECRLEITNEDKEKQGHGEQTGGSVLFKKKKKKKSPLLELGRKLKGCCHPSVSNTCEIQCWRDLLCLKC